VLPDGESDARCTSGNYSDATHDDLLGVKRETAAPPPMVGDAGWRLAAIYLLFRATTNVESFGQVTKVTASDFGYSFSS
jgi:hypothetical protein